MDNCTYIKIIEHLYNESDDFNDLIVLLTSKMCYMSIVRVACVDQR